MSGLSTRISMMQSTSKLTMAANQIYTYTKKVLGENSTDDKNNEPMLTPFGACLVSMLSNNNNYDDKDIHVKDNHETYANCELIDNKLVLSKASRSDIMKSLTSNRENMKSKTAGTLKLRHFELCPANQMSEQQRSSIPESVKIRNIGVAVAVLLETFDGSILLTRRASHMRTFPNIWVPPGGSIDWDEESLFAAGLRELQEETNLQFADEDIVSCKPLCMWESMYPTMLSKGDAKRQHSVVYFHIAVNKSKQDIQPHIILQEKEVGASAWFDRNLVELACGQRDGYICDKDIVNNKLETKCQVPKTFTIFTFLTKSGEESSSCQEIEWPTNVLRLRVQDSGTECTDIERLSSGTIFALQEWLQSKSIALN